MIVDFLRGNCIRNDSFSEGNKLMLEIISLQRNLLYLIVKEQEIKLEFLCLKSESHTKQK